MLNGRPFIVYMNKNRMERLTKLSVRVDPCVKNLDERLRIAFWKSFETGLEMELKGGGMFVKEST